MFAIVFSSISCCDLFDRGQRFVPSFPLRLRKSRNLTHPFPKCLIGDRKWTPISRNPIPNDLGY